MSYAEVESIFKLLYLLLLELQFNERASLYIIWNRKQAKRKQTLEKT